VTARFGGPNRYEVRVKRPPNCRPGTDGLAFGQSREAADVGFFADGRDQVAELGFELRDAPAAVVLCPGSQRLTQRLLGHGFVTELACTCARCEVNHAIPTL
jgi:hypothetical protein